MTLPHKDTLRWTKKRREAIAEHLLAGELSVNEALLRYKFLSKEELMEWCERLGRHG